MSLYLFRNSENLRVRVTLRLTVSQSVSQSVSKSWCRAQSGAHDQTVITVWQLRSCFCGAPSLTRGWVCLLYMLLALASAVFIGSESLGTRDHILLSQIWDFPFSRLLRLAGSRWRYSTLPPHEYLKTYGSQLSLYSRNTDRAENSLSIVVGEYLPRSCIVTVAARTPSKTVPVLCTRICSSIA
jgi:hypothetical protein